MPQGGQQAQVREFTVMGPPGEPKIENPHGRGRRYMVQPPTRRREGAAAQGAPVGSQRFRNTVVLTRVVAVVQIEDECSSLGTPLPAHPFLQFPGRVEFEAGQPDCWNKCTKPGKAHYPRGEVMSRERTQAELESCSRGLAKVERMERVVVAECTG